VIATQGFAAQEAWDALHRALSLAPQVGNPLDVFHILYMLVNASLARADAVWSPRLADELMRAAEQIGSEEALLVAGMLSANGALWQGNHSGTKGLADAARADPVALGRFVPARTRSPGLAASTDGACGCSGSPTRPSRLRAPASTVDGRFGTPATSR
jgi:hypothetical protein